jgi:hypothetical protein
VCHIARHDVDYNDLTNKHQIYRYLGSSCGLASVYCHQHNSVVVRRDNDEQTAGADTADTAIGTPLAMDLTANDGNGNEKGEVLNVPIRPSIQSKALFLLTA